MVIWNGITDGKHSRAKAHEQSAKTKPLGNQATHRQDGVRSQRSRESLEICRQTPEVQKGKATSSSKHVMTTAPPMDEWNTTPWRQVERRVFKLQKRIYRATQRGDKKTAHRLQRLLMKSQAGKQLAVRRVTQDNRGKRTAGIDGVKNLTPPARQNLVQNLKLNCKASPLRRIYCPKPGTAEQRPLGIPTIKDRATQALVKLALEPEWEAQFEPNVYGFRPGRSAQDAIEAIFISVHCKPTWVLDADIEKCFDRIAHTTLLDKLNTFPVLRRQVRAWLKAGVMEGQQWFPSTAGTPQGGIISPLLANIALHGMETQLKQFVYALKLPPHNGQRTPPSRRLRSLQIIRYADDFVVIHPDRRVIEACQDWLGAWLAPLGLKLKPSKTQIVHTLEGGTTPPGFDFLGFNVRQYPVSPHHSGRNSHGHLRGFKTLIKPSKASVKRHYAALKQSISKLKAAKQERLIAVLNPQIKGWCNYFRTKVSKVTFSKLDHLIFKALWSWARHRHPHKGKRWRKRRYWLRADMRNWVFSTRDSPALLNHSHTSIRRHVKVRGNASPFDGNSVYWSQRLQRHPELPTRVAKLLQRQKGKCPCCGLLFRDDDVWEVDHILPKAQGGQDSFSNLQLLHRHCHHQKSRLERSV